MKRCPQCRRDYHDETLLYCLDDGTALLEGPASADEAVTAILSEPIASSEAPTRRQIDRADAELDSTTSPRAAKPLALLIVAGLLVAGAFSAYR